MSKHALPLAPLCDVAMQAAREAGSQQYGRTDRQATCIGFQDGCAERRQPLLSTSTAASSLGFSRRSTSMAAAQLLCLIHTVAKTGVRSADLSMTESVRSY